MTSNSVPVTAISPNKASESIAPQMASPRPGYQMTPEEVREFQAIVAEETGVTLSAREAWDRAIELIALVRALVESPPEACSRP